MAEFNKNSAIAVYDSGVGGLTVMREIASLLGSENIIYFSDSANCPYGGKSNKQIVGLARRVVEQLLGYDVKIIVVACNTATTNAIAELRAEFPFIPFVGTEPAVKPAVENTVSGVVGVLATRSTIRSHVLEDLRERYGDDKRVIAVAGEGLVELVEENKEDGEECKTLLSSYLIPLICEGIDYLVLGCTHYPFLETSIKELTSAYGITIVNPAPSVARRVGEVLKENNMLTTRSGRGTREFYSSCENEEYVEKLKDRFEKWRN